MARDTTGRIDVHGRRVLVCLLDGTKIVVLLEAWAYTTRKQSLFRDKRARGSQEDGPMLRSWSWRACRGGGSVVGTVCAPGAKTQNLRPSIDAWCMVGTTIPHSKTRRNRTWSLSSACGCDTDVEVEGPAVGCRSHEGKQGMTALTSTDARHT